MKRLILVLDDKKLASGINSAILNLLKQEQVGYWHWYRYTWLITDPRERTVAWWRDKLKEIEPRPGFLLFGLDDGSWSGFTQKKYYDWMYENWKRQPPPNT